MTTRESARAPAGVALALAVAAALALSACLAETAEEQTPSTETWTTIQTMLAASSCSCHQSAPAGANGGVSFPAQDYSAIFDMASVNFPSPNKIVAPNNSAGSTLYMMAAGSITPPVSTGTNMQLSAANAARIKGWIDAGALQ